LRLTDWNERPEVDAMSTRSELKATLRDARDELQLLRDEIRLKLHLGGMDAKAAWRKLEPSVEDFERELIEAGDTVNQTTLELWGELRESLRGLRDQIVRPRRRKAG
jgi:hypothetical protein